MLTSLLYRIYWWASSVKYWATRRFTYAGWLVLIGLVMTAGIGLDTEQSLAYQAFGVLFCLLFIALASCVFFRGRITVRRILPQFGSVDMPLAYRVMMRNQSSKVQTGLELLENLMDPRPDLKEFVAALRPTKRTRSFRLSQPKPRSHQVALAKELPLPPLPPDRETEVRVELIPLKRGPLRFAGMTLARTDPFGLFRAFINLPLPQTVLILPKRYLLPPIPLPGAMKYQQGGVALASSVGQSEEFVSLRDYRRGDPLRHVHWRSWAKTGRPIVKEFLDEFFVRHALILDTFSEPGDEDIFEEAVSIAASFAWTIQTQESLLDLMFVGAQAICFTVGRGVAHTEQMLEILASVARCREKSFSVLEQLVMEHVTTVSGCICVFVAWDEARQSLVRQLRAIGIPLLVFVVTETGAADSLEPGPLSEEPQCFHPLEVGKIGEGLAKL
jgi:uncharacterized protein (DUF58 family)